LTPDASIADWGGGKIRKKSKASKPRCEALTVRDLARLADLSLSTLYRVCQAGGVMVHRCTGANR
jgi:hypothetical protein